MSHPDRNDRRRFMRGQWLREFARLPTPDGASEIASVIVQVLPACMAAVAELIRAIPQAEIAATDPRGKLIVLIEASRDDRLGEILTDLSVLPDVLSATLVYHGIARAQVAGEEVA